MGHSLQRWQLQYHQVLQWCVAQGTATPPWQGASPNRAEQHNCSGVGQCPCRQPNPAHEALGSCRATVAGRFSACCPAAISAAVSAVVGLGAAWTSPCPACAAPLLVLPAPCLCCPHPAWPTRAVLLPTPPHCLPYPGCPDAAHTALLPMPWQCCSSVSPKAYRQPPAACCSPALPSSAQPFSHQLLPSQHFPSACPGCWNPDTGCRGYTHFHAPHHGSFPGAHPICPHS